MEFTGVPLSAKLQIRSAIMDVGKRVMGIEVQGSRRRGRPKKRWADCVKDDLREKGLSGDEVCDRDAWRRLSYHIDPTHKWDKDEEEGEGEEEEEEEEEE